MNKITDIPKKFTIANNVITVELVDELEGGEYGLYKDSTNTIKVARTVDGDALNDEQILNTFIHELIHVFQFYFDNNFDEAQAQCFANFIREFEKSKTYGTN